MQIKDNTFSFNVRVTNVKTRILAFFGIISIGSFFNVMWIDVFYPDVEKILLTPLETENTQSVILRFIWISISVYVFLGTLLTLFTLFLKGKLKTFKEEGLVLSLIVSFIVGFIGGFIVGLIIGFISAPFLTMEEGTLLPGLMAGLIAIVGLILGLIWGLILGLWFEFKKNKIE